MKNATNNPKVVEADKNVCFNLTQCHVTNGFFVMSNGFYEKVMYEDILWLESYHNYLDIHLKGDQKICVIHSLSRMEDFLPKTSFIRIHRSVIINIQAVTRFVGSVVYIGKRRLDVSRSYHDRVFSCFDVLERKRSLEGTDLSNSWTEADSG